MGGSVFPPCYLPGPNYAGGNKDNGYLLTKITCMYCYTHCPQPCSTPLAHPSVGDYWTLLASPFHYRGLECKSRKSRNTWSDRQIWPWNKEWSRAKTNRVLPKKCTGYSKHPLPTTQGKTLYMDITRWSTPKSDWLYSLQPKMEKLYTVNKNKTRNWLWIRSWTPYCQIQTEIEESRENH